MTPQTTSRSAFSLRITPEEQQLIAQAAKREHRSINSFVVRAALNAARESQGVARTPEAVEAAVRRAQQLMAKYKRPGVSLVDELIAERRADAERE